MRHSTYAIVHITLSLSASCVYAQTDAWVRLNTGDVRKIPVLSPDKPIVSVPLNSEIPVESASIIQTPIIPGYTFDPRTDGNPENDPRTDQTPVEDLYPPQDPSAQALGNARHPTDIQHALFACILEHPSWQHLPRSFSRTRAWARQATDPAYGYTALTCYIVADPAATTVVWMARERGQYRDWTQPTRAQRDAYSPGKPREDVVMLVPMGGSASESGHRFGRPVNVFAFAMLDGPDMRQVESAGGASGVRGDVTGRGREEEEEAGNGGFCWVYGAERGFYFEVRPDAPQRDLSLTSVMGLRCFGGEHVPTDEHLSL